MTLTATVTTKATKTGRLYTVALSDGTVATRSSTKEKAAIMVYADGTVQTGFGTTLSLKPATLIQTARLRGAPWVVVELATGRVLAEGGTPAPAVKPSKATHATPSAALTKFRNAPGRVAKQALRDIAFWGADHPTSALWGRMAERAEALTTEEVDALFAAGLRTSGDLESHLERLG